jgi:hypothetical protein
MSNPATIYFGSKPTRGEEVSPEVKEKGLDLLKMDTSQVRVHGGPTLIQPNYSVYKMNLAQFFYSAIEDTYISPRTDPYIPLNYTGETIAIPYPALVVSWSSPVSEDIKDEMRGLGFRDYVARGKPAMIHEQPTADLAKTAISKGCIQTTATSANTMNIKDLIQAQLLLRIITAFIKLNQYPAFIDEDHVEEFSKNFEGGFSMKVTLRGIMT